MAVTYSVSTNIITVTAYTEAVPANITDIYNADKAGTLSLHARTGIAGTDGAPVATDRAERPADYIVLGGASNDLYITIANWNGTTATIRTTGTDRDGAAQTEDIVVNANGNYNTTKWFKTITHTQVTAFTATSFDCDLTQGQWGVVSTRGSDQFYFDCLLHVGDASTTTWMADVRKQVVFNSGLISSGWDSIVTVKNLAHLRLGVLSSAPLKTTRDGCAIKSLETSLAHYLISTLDGGYLEVYNSMCNSDVALSGYSIVGGSHTGSYLGNVKIYNTVFHRVFPYNTQNFDIYNLNVEYVNIGCGTMGGTFDRMLCTQTNVFGVYFQNFDTTLENLVIKDMVAGVMIRCKNISGNSYLVNPDLSTWTFSWLNSAAATLYRQYEFDLKLIDGGGTGIDTGKVKIWDKDDSLVTNTTTNASGVLATQTLNYGYYTQTGGNTPTMKTPHETRVYKYGKEMLSSKSNIENKTDWALTMLTDPHITQTTEATVAAYTGITINHTAETITISENHTLDEIYDYCQYDIIAATKQLDQTMHTADGVNFVSEYSFVVNTGITVTATDQKLSTVSGETYTLTGTAQFTGIIATTTTTRIPVKLTNIVDGSRYWVGKESDGSKIFDGTQSGSGTVTGYYEHTANINIDIRVRKSSASVKYQPWVGEGTLIADAFSLRIRQIQDSIIT